MAKRKLSDRERRRRARRGPPKPVEPEVVLREALDYYEDYLNASSGGYRFYSPALSVLYGKLVDAVRNDLMSLAREGAHPRIILDIVILDLIWGGATELKKQSSAELRRLSSPRYWDRGRRFLETADEFLSDLMSHVHVEAASWSDADPERFPFVGISVQAKATASAVRDFLSIIERLALDQPGWRLALPNETPRYPQIVWDEKCGKERGGRSKKVDWGFCATMLHVLFKRTTGKPHRGVVARLLHYAGYTGRGGFPEALPPEYARMDRSNTMLDRRREYTQRIRARVKENLSDPEVNGAVEYNLRHFKSRLQSLGNYRGWGERLTSA